MTRARSLKAPRVHLEAPGREHETEFLAAAARSGRLHGRWVRAPRTAKEYRALVARSDEPRFRGHLVCTETGALAGVINLSEIVLGLFRSAYLGYYAFEPYAGQGCLRRGLELVLQRAFGRYGLHRLEANIQPENVRSIALVRSLGFTCEGYSKRYLKIAGRFRDHERWAITREDFRAHRARARARARRT